MVCSWCRAFADMFFLFFLRRPHFCRHRWWSVAGECKGTIIWAIGDLCFLVVSLSQLDKAIDWLPDQWSSPDFLDTFCA